MMADIKFLNPFESDKDAPPNIRYDVLAEVLDSNPNIWSIVAREETERAAKCVAKGLRSRKCLAQVKLRSDGFYYVFACAWRFSDESS